MKGHKVQTAYYQKLETDFKDWLQTLGYSKQTVYNWHVNFIEIFAIIYPSSFM